MSLATTLRAMDRTRPTPRSTRHRRLAVAIGAVCLAAAIVPVAPTRAAAPVAPVRPAPGLGAASLVADVASASEPSVSSDGRWVVFGGVVDGRTSVFRTDRNTGSTAELSPVPSSVTSGDTIHPLLSSDGCVVVAITEVAFDLFRDNDRGDRWDVYRLVVPECGGQPNAWELVSTTRRGDARDGVFTDAPAAINRSGAVIAYAHQLDGAPDGVATLSVVDVTVPVGEPGRVTQVAGMPAEAPNRAYSYRGATDPVLSDDGRHLAFVADTTASAALPGWAAGPELGGPATAQVYVWDRAAADQRRAVQLMSGRDGIPSDAGARSPAMSADGRVVAFVSSDRTLVPAELPPCGATCPTQIYRFDRDTDGNGVFDELARRPPLTLVSAVDAGVASIGVPVAGDASSWAPALDAGGTSVAFVTDATNLLPSRRGGGGGPADGDLLVAEVLLGSLRRVVEGADATAVPGAHSNPALSRTGQTIVFETAAPGALLGDLRLAGSDRAIVAVDVTPRLSLADLDFGTVLLNVESAELYVRVQNAGPGAFEPASVDVSSGFRISGGSCARGILVAPGATCSIYLTFRPTAIRGYSGTLSVTGRGDEAPAVSANVRGAAGDPVLLADPGGVDLADGVVGVPGASVAVDITNVGFLPTQIARIALGGAHPDDFEITSQTCRNRFVNPDATCVVEVQFTPTEAGFRSALLVVTTTIGEYTSAVVGGFARYEPTLETSTSVLRVGTQLGIGVNGFPPSTDVSIGFDDGSAPLATLQTNEAGSTLAIIPMPLRVRAGEHRLVASAAGSAVASATVVLTAPQRGVTPGVPGYGLG